MKVTYRLIAVLSFISWNGRALATDQMPESSPVQTMVPREAKLRMVRKNYIQVQSMEIDLLVKDHRITDQVAEPLRANLEAIKVKYDLNSKLSEEDVRAMRKALKENSDKIFAAMNASGGKKQ